VAASATIIAFVIQVINDAFKPSTQLRKRCGERKDVTEV
jgi:hypothetical protein